MKSGLDPSSIPMHLGLYYKTFLPLKPYSESRKPYPFNHFPDRTQAQIPNILGVGKKGT